MLSDKHSILGKGAVDFVGIYNFLVSEAGYQNINLSFCRGTGPQVLENASCYMMVLNGLLSYRHLSLPVQSSFSLVVSGICSQGCLSWNIVPVT